MKKPLQFLSALYFAADGCAVTLAYAVAYYLRFHVQVIPLTKGLPPLEPYLYLFPVSLALWLTANRLSGLYGAQRKYSLIDEAIAVGKSGTLATLLLIAMTFFYREVTFSRTMLVLFWFISLGLSFLFRVVIIRAMQIRHRKGFNLTSALIVGAGPLGQIIAQKIGELPQLGIKVVGFIDNAPPPGISSDLPRVLGKIEDINEVIRAHNVSNVFIALPRKAHERLEKTLMRLDKEVVDVRVVPDILQFVLLKAGLENLDGIPIINLSETPLSGWYSPVKRLADVVFSLAGLVLLAPVFLLFAIVIKYTTPGPVFFRQERMSLDGTVFTMLKFRSMREDAEAETGAVWTSPDDPRRTGFGAFIRRTSLDELPQLINILKGEMSFVGPRPERPVFVEEFRERVPRYMLRHKVKCGLTGWAQVNGWRGNTSIQKRIEYDMFYIENWSLTFDLKIIWKTLLTGMAGKHAY